MQVLETEVIKLRTRIETLEQDMEQERGSRLKGEVRIEQLLLSLRVAQQKRHEQDQVRDDQSMQRTVFLDDKNRSMNERVGYMEFRTDGLRDGKGW